MKKKSYTISAKVWMYPGNASWHFVSLHKEISSLINLAHKGPRAGWGSIPVSVLLGKSTWDTSIFWSKEGIYLLPLKASVRKKEGIFADDEVTFLLSLR